MNALANPKATYYDWQPAMTREQWLLYLTEALRPLFIEHNKPLPPIVRVSVGFPSKGARSNAIGQCHYDDAGPHIFIHPNQQESHIVAGILLHELVHAALGPGFGHGKDFKKLAAAVGLVGKATSAAPSEETYAALKALYAPVGPFLHVALIGRGPAPRPQPEGEPRLINLRCPEDGFFAKVLSEQRHMGRLNCPACGQPLLTKEERA